MELFLYGSEASKDFLQNNPHEAGEVKFLESKVRAGMTVIDVGANVGVSSVAIGRKIGKHGKLYSFEPVPRYFRILQQNLSFNKLDNVEAFRVALSDRAGEADFYLKELSSGIVFEKQAKKIRINTTTIDRFLQERKTKRIDMINMNCEGSELVALRGAKESLQRNDVQLFCELHHDFLRQLGQSVHQIVEYLEKLGYEVHGVSLGYLTMSHVFEGAEYLYAKKTLHNIV